MREKLSFLEVSFLEKRKIACLFAVVAVCCTITVIQGRQSTRAMLPIEQKTVILDAGHGGWDPGKVGSSGADEKVINLAVVEKLQRLLEQGGATVYVTRAVDEALGAGKKADMAQRRKIANESDGDVLVSIHQNAFPSAKAKGAQVFYHKTSASGKKLAEAVQESLRTYADDKNQRLAKENSDYYILRTTEIPAVIVECGFLSNPEEEKKLNQEEYQEKLAWAIYGGILDYFAQEEDASL